MVLIVDFGEDGAGRRYIPMRWDVAEPLDVGGFVGGVGLGGRESWQTASPVIYDNQRILLHCNSLMLAEFS